MTFQMDGKISLYLVLIYPDNIENRIKGIALIFELSKNNSREMPSALFVAGNSSVNIRDGEALFTGKGKQQQNAVFGKGPKDAVELGKGIQILWYRWCGFDVGSIQFSRYNYKFENPDTFNGFIRNASEQQRLWTSL